MQVAPKMRIRLADDFGMIDAQMGMHDGKRSKRHGHAVIFVSVDGVESRLATSVIPNQFVVIHATDEEAHLAELVLQGFYAVGFLDLQARQSREVEGNSQGAARHDNSLCQIGAIDEVKVQMLHTANLMFQSGNGLTRLGISAERGFHA